MRMRTSALCLLATPALADVAGPAGVIDGDSLREAGERIRLHGIDAPESRQLCRFDGQPWQCRKDAANALADEIARRPVTSEDLSNRKRFVFFLYQAGHVVAWKVRWSAVKCAGRCCVPRPCRSRARKTCRLRGRRVPR